MNLKQLLDRLGDDVNPRVVLLMRATLGKRIIATFVYLAILGVYAWAVTCCSGTIPPFLFELALGVLVVYAQLFFVTISSLSGIARDEMLVLAMNDMSPSSRFQWAWVLFLIDSLYVGMTTLPFIVLASYSLSSFGRLFLIVVTACVSFNVFVMEITLPLLSIKKKENRWFARLISIICVNAVPMGLILHMRWMYYPPFTPAIPGQPEFQTNGLLFFLFFLSVYYILGCILCRVHLRWNLGHPYREAIVNGLVFGPFGIAVFRIGYALFG